MFSVRYYISCPIVFSFIIHKHTHKRDACTTKTSTTDILFRIIRGCAAMLSTLCRDVLCDADDLSFVFIPYTYSALALAMWVTENILLLYFIFCINA